MSPQRVGCQAFPGIDVVVPLEDFGHAIIHHLRLDGTAPQNACPSPSFHGSVENALTVPVGVAVVVPAYRNADRIAINFR